MARPTLIFRKRGSEADSVPYTQLIIPADRIFTAYHPGRERASRRLSMLASAGVGALTMYFLDPERGRRRRAMVRDQVLHSVNIAGDALDATARDLRNRAIGVVAESRAVVRRGSVPDEVLAERVRAKLGRLVSHPSAIEVSAANGVVTLRGPVIRNEVDRLLRGVSGIRGVKAVENQLAPHDGPSDIPALQGQPDPARLRSGLGQEYWSPATRMVATLTGAGLSAYGLTRRTPMGWFSVLAGLPLMARGLTNMPLQRLTGLRGGRRAVDFHKTINVNAPPQKVYELWRNFENFPRFMSHLVEVRQTGGGRSHWTMRGPAGVTLQWDAELTKDVPNQLIAWKTLEGEPIRHAGIVRFDRNPDGSTRVDVGMSYNPPAGAIGHLLATMLGTDPKSVMDDDLMRMKTFVETGHRPSDAGAEYVH